MEHQSWLCTVCGSIRAGSAWCDTPRDSNSRVRWRAEEGATGLGIVSLLVYTGHCNPSLAALPHEVCVPSGPFVDFNDLEPSWGGCPCPNAQCCVTLCRSAAFTCFGCHGYKKEAYMYGFQKLWRGWEARGMTQWSLSGGPPVELGPRTTRFQTTRGSWALA